MPRGFPTFLILLLASAAVLHAGGSGEEEFDAKAELEKANSLIDEGKLDAAIAILVDIAKVEPDQMERVQNLILEVRSLKVQVNDLFEGLAEAVSLGDEALADEKIRAIKDIDSDPNRNTLNNLILAAIVVGKARNDLVRDGIYEQGNALMDSGQHPQAVEQYRSGFINDAYLEFYDDYIALAEERTEIVRYRGDPQRQSRIWEAYSSIAPRGNTVIASLQSALDAWDESAARLSEITASTLTTIESEDPPQWTLSLQTFADFLVDLEAEHTGITTITDELEGLRTAMNDALDGIPEDFRYERIGQFMKGRPGKEGREGIIAAQQQLWEDSYQEVAATADDRVVALLTDGWTALRIGDWPRAESSFAVAARAVEEADAYAPLGEERLAGRDEGDAPSFLEESAALRQHALAALPIWGELIELGRNASRSAPPTGLDIEEESAAADLATQNLEQAEALKLQWDGRTAALSAMPGSGGAKPREVKRALEADLERSLTGFQNRQVQEYLGTLVSLYGQLEADAREAMSTDIPATRFRINGPEIPEGSDALPERHPTDALESIVSPALLRLGEVQSNLEDFLETLQRALESPSPISDSGDVADYVRRGGNLLTALLEHRQSVDILGEEAQLFSNTAKRFLAEADNTLDAARREVAAAQDVVTQSQQGGGVDVLFRAIDYYAAADDLLNTVDSLYFEVLVNDVDLARESGLDEERSSLRNQVQTDRSRLAVNVKQDAITEARSAYSDNRYTYAITLLNQSQDFWNRAYGENDGEIDSWLTRLRNAQQTLSQTTIAPTDPLHAEMYQYLNLAQRHYATGISIVEANPRSADALAAFRASGDLISLILSIFPGNEAALLLEQRILRQTDAETWATSAQAVVNETRRAVNANAVLALRGDSRQKGLYAQIKVLEEIAPGFPGLESLIYDVEVALGIVIPPPDPAVLAESRSLSNQARQIWVNLGLTGAERSLELLDSALELWLENAEASRLKDEILLSFEPESLPSFPPELLNLISLLEQYFSQGDLILAQAFIDRITGEFPQFASDPRIRDWVEKVKARQ